MKNPFGLLKGRYALFIGSVVLTVVAGQAFIQYNLDQKEKDDLLIDVAGKQRVLSQRIAKIVVYMRQEILETGLPKPRRIDTLRTLVSELKSVHLTLLHRSGDSKNSLLVDSLLRSCTPRLTRIVAASDSLMLTPLPVVAEESVKLISKDEVPFLLLMQSVVDAYHKEAEEKMDYLKKVELILSALTIFIISLGFIYIFLPMLNKLRANNRKQFKLNRALAITNNELKSSQLEISAQLAQINALNSSLEIRERQYRELVDNASDMIYELNSEGALSFGNPVIESTFGLTQKELIGKMYWELVHPDDRKRVVEFYGQQRKNRQESSYLEFRMVTKTGQEIWAGQNCKMFFKDGWVYKVSAVARDMTQLLQTQKKLVESEKLYRLLSENSQDVISLAGLDGIFQFVSPSSLVLLGFTPEEMVGRSIAEFVHPEEAIDIENMNAAILKKRIEGAAVAPFQGRVRTKAGNYVWVETIVLPFYSNDKLIGFQAALRDISMRKEQEFALIKAKDNAEEATRAKSRFLSMMSHEIRTPMNAIIGLSNFLLEDNPRPEQVENLNLLKFSGENLLTIINDILDFSKIEADKITLENIDFDMHLLLSNVTKMMQNRAAEKNINLTFEYDPRLPRMLKSDPVRLGQIITNLLGNAIKFTEKGSVTLSASLQQIHDGQVTIHFRVVDTGIGIHYDKLATIFESFSQATEDTTRKFGGTGLGLTITKRLINLMGSEIQVDSIPGTGSTFSFTLQLAKGKALAQTPVADTDLRQELKNKKVMVLVAEDNRVNQIVATNFLKSWGISWLIANNGLEALALIQGKSVQLVFMDLQMPEMDGYEATLAIRAMNDPYFKNIPIIALSASAMTDIREKSLEVGMTDFITKPFQPVELQKIIRKYVLDKEPKEGQRSFSPNLDLYVEGNDEFKMEFISQIIKNVGELQKAFDNALLSRDSSVFGRIVHKCTSTLRILGDQELIDCVEKTQDALDQLKDDNRKFPPSIELTFQSLCKSTMEALEEVELDLKSNF